MIRVTVEDLESGESQSKEIENDYILVCAGNYYLAHANEYPRSGTVQLTIKKDRKDSE